MIVLFRNRQMGFTTLRDALGLTDGNLASHAERLVEAGYVEARRTLTKSGLEVRYYVTEKGASAFAEYMLALKSLLDPEGGGGAPLPEKSTGPRSWEESIS